MNLAKKLLLLGAVGAGLTFISCEQPAHLMEGNNRPIITSTPVLEVNEGQTYNYQIVATDEDEDKLTYSLIPTEDKNNDWLSVNSDTGMISGTVPRIKQETKFPVTTRVSDGKDTFTQDFVLTAKEVFDYSVSPGQSIQNAINSAPEGSKIGVRSGTYNQNLNVNKRIFLIGIDGEVNLTPASDSPVVTISASGNSREEPLFLKNFNIYTSGTGSDPGKKTGLWIAATNPLAHIGLDDIVITGNNIKYETSGLESGLSISPNVSVDDLVIENCNFKNLSYGFISGAITSANPGYLRNLIMKDTILENNSSKGFYTERLSNAIFTRVTAKNNGNTALSASWADDYNTGMDINLKYGNYRGITFRDLIVTGNGVGSSKGAGLAIKARGTGTDPSYSAIPATLTNALIFGGTFTGNNFDILLGEPGKGNTQPARVLLKGATYGILKNELAGVIPTIQN